MEGSKSFTDWQHILVLREEWRRAEKRVVWTNGCFDILHAGHVRSLQQAKALGDVLVVGLNSDRSVRALKGPQRPVMGEAERAELLTALSCVDQVILFDDLTPEEALRRLQPDIHCKGDDYRPPHGKPIPELELVEAYGGRVEFLPRIPGLSTSELIERIRKLP